MEMVLVISLDNAKFQTVVYGSPDVCLELSIAYLSYHAYLISLLPCITAVHTLVAMLYLANYKKAMVFIV